MFSQAKVLGNYLASVLMWWMNNLSVLAFSLESTGYISGSPGAAGGEESGGWREPTYLRLGSCFLKHTSQMEVCSTVMLTHLSSQAY